jgi:uncharacterized protein YkwD
MHRVRFIGLIMTLVLLAGCGDAIEDAVSSEISPQTNPGTMIALTDDEKGLLNAHNEERARYTGVGPFQWSPELAKFAQEWAGILLEKDKLEHRIREDRCDKNKTGQEVCVGENLWTGSSSNPTKIFPVKDMVGPWIAEKADYHYNDNTCTPAKVCGHFTQVVWKNSTLVGCGQARKESPTGVKMMLACNYSPSGNFVGQRPF